jgi:hypothetical protein
MATLAAGILGRLPHAYRFQRQFNQARQRARSLPLKSREGEHMDRNARQRLIDRVLRMYDSNVLPAVPMEEFFTGNTDDWSVGRHMQTSREIPIAEYAAVFRTVRARPDVHEVYIWVNELPDDSDPDERETWPQAHVAFVITSAAATEVESWFHQVEPRYADAEWNVRREVALPWADSLPNGMRPVMVELL